ncbi:BTAD domain-containing putative transcriptional regulator [Kineococcus gypseus]|uniref:BTAD domain-containing putative transcriptional regulator n=1 Tax=Kineococcus gypseus TaxID=1637102 RepID=UPI003D7C5689
MATRVLVLGPLEVHRDGRVLAVRRGRPRRLLLALLLRRGGAVAPDALIDQLWGDDPPLNADNALQVLVSYLRKAVGGEDLRLERVPAGYRLALPVDAVDATRFEALVRTASAPATGPAARLRAGEQALALWRGPALLEAADDDFARGDAARLHELRLQAHEARAEALLELGRHHEALPDLSGLVREHPFQERLHTLLALALYRAGRQAEALAALDAAGALLAEELGLDPTAQLQELRGRILRQDPLLDAPPSRGGTAAGPDVPAAPPAAPAPAPRPEEGATPVPTALTSLVGREEQVLAVRALVAEHRVVTLTGPGGTGKSRLAAECARTGTHPARWVELSAVTDRDALVTTVAAALGVRPAPGADPAAQLLRGAARLEGLVVLDTCEHLVTDVRDLVEGLVGASPGLRVLATSRSPLGAAGELTWPVPPLPLPPAGERDPQVVRRSRAVQLFCERAAMVRPGFTLDGGNAGDVAAVCTLLDGLPLALELAAGHVAALSPAKIAALLRERTRLVSGEPPGGGGRPGHARHAGLRATIDWSYGLLSPQEALFLDRLSVFAGPFPLEAGVEVAGEGLDDGLQLLLSLVRQSLVTTTGTDRFRLLDTVGAHVAERLAARPGEEGAARERHARWFAQFAREADRGIRGPDQEGWLADLRAAGQDLRAALEHCSRAAGGLAGLGAELVCSLSWFWSFEGAFTQARTWIAAAQAAGPHTPSTAARLHRAAGMHAKSVGDLRAAERHCTAAAAAFAALGDVRGEGEVLLSLGTVQWALGRLDEAAAAHDRCAALCSSVGDDAGAGAALVLRARTALDEGDAALARELLARGHQLSMRSGDRHLVALALEQLARTHLHQGDTAAAEDFAARSAELFERLGYAEGVLAARQTLGQVHAARGHAAAAQEAYRRATGRALELAHAAAAVEGFELLAALRAARGDHERAARLLGHAEALREQGSLPRTPSQARRLASWALRSRSVLAGGWERLRDAGGRTPSGELLADLPDEAPADARRAAG